MTRRSNEILEKARTLKTHSKSTVGAVLGRVARGLERRAARLQQSTPDKSVDLVEQQAGRIKRQHQRIERLQGQLARKEQNLVKLRERVVDSRFPVMRRPPIFFVVGLQRSGTNWLMRTLNSHPDILCRGEGRFFDRDFRNPALKEMQTTEHIKKKIQPSSLYNALAEAEYLRLWVERSVWTRDSDTEEQIDHLTREAIYHFLSESLSKTNKRIVGDKTPLGRPETISEIGRLCPEARVIHIVRDGRDQAISQMHHVWNRSKDEGGVSDLPDEALDKRNRYRESPEAFLGSSETIFHTGHLERAARNWSDGVKATHRDGTALLGERYTEVRYEELLSRPEKEFGRLFDYLGAASDEDTVARCVGSTSFEKRSGGRKPGEENTLSGVRKGIAGDWKGVFNEQDRRIYKEAAGDLLMELGYEMDEDW